MILDLNDSESIVAWFDVHPARHGAQLAALAKLQPAFAPAIKQAGTIIRNRKAQHVAQHDPDGAKAGGAGP